MSNIRKANEKDIKKIEDLLEQVNMVHHNGRPDLFKSGGKKYTQNELIDIFNNDKTPVFVYVDDDDIVLGYAFCILKQFIDNNIMTDIKTLYIDDLCVDEKCRGKEIGKKLYEFVLDYAKKIDCHSVTLNVWCLNEPAMKFYKKCGLTEQKITMEQLL